MTKVKRAARVKKVTHTHRGDRKTSSCVLVSHPSAELNPADQAMLAWVLPVLKVKKEKKK